MKFLLLILVVLAAVWLVRSARRQVKPPANPNAPTPPAAVQPIVACMHCGVHLPSGEALPGRGGVFCGEAHRAEFEKTNPPA